MGEDEEIAELDTEINSYFDENKAQRWRRRHPEQAREYNRAAQRRRRLGPKREEILQAQREWMRDYRERKRQEALHVK